METDSDYCSWESSDGNSQNASGPPTPPVTADIKKAQEMKANVDTTKNHVQVEKRLVFLVGNEEEVVELRISRHSISAWKNPDIIAKLIPLNMPKATGVKDGRGKLTDIKLPDWEPQAFKIFLHFLQVEEIKLEECSVDRFGDLIKLCMAYGVPKLLSQINSTAKQSLSLNNCVKLYKLGALHEMEELRVIAYNYILKAGNAFVEHKSFLDLDSVTLSILISSDDFPVIEVILFRRLRQWVTKQCKRLGYPPEREELFKRVAGLLFCHVRYSQMTPREFRTEVVPSGLLNKKDIEGINLRHRNPPNVWHSLAPYSFVDRPRLAKLLHFVVPLYNNVQIGFRKIDGASNTIQESVRLMVSHDIYLTSIGFFGPAKADRCANGGAPLTTYSIRIHVEGDYTKYHCRCPPQNATVVSRDSFSVDLSTPFQIQKLQPYKLTVWIDGDVTQFGVFPLPQAVVLLPHKGLITFHFSDADSDPPPSIDTSGNPSSSSPITTFPPATHNRPYKQEPRSSGVIRSISFVVRD